MTLFQSETRTASRSGLLDIWNARLCVNASWSELDNPKVQTTAAKPPDAVISWPDAKQIHERRIKAGDREYHVNVTIHCYIDDHKFDGIREGIWKRWDLFYKIAQHFDGIMGIDFSTYADFPEPLLRYQFFRMRVIEHGAIQRGIPVIVNARWGAPHTWEYCFDALPEQQMLSIGAVGSGLKTIENRQMFEKGLFELVKRKRPTALVVVGAAQYPALKVVQNSGVPVYSYESAANARFKKRVICNV